MAGQCSRYQILAGKFGSKHLRSRFLEFQVWSKYTLKLIPGDQVILLSNWSVCTVGMKSEYTISQR